MGDGERRRRYVVCHHLREERRRRERREQALAELAAELGPTQQQPGRHPGRACNTAVERALRSVPAPDQDRALDARSRRGRRGRAAGRQVGRHVQLRHAYGGGPGPRLPAVEAGRALLVVAQARPPSASPVPPRTVADPRPRHQHPAEPVARADRGKCAGETGRNIAAESRRVKLVEHEQAGARVEQTTELVPETERRRSRSEVAPPPRIHAVIPVAPPPINVEGRGRQVREITIWPSEPGSRGSVRRDGRDRRLLRAGERSEDDKVGAQPGRDSSVSGWPGSDSGQLRDGGPTARTVARLRARSRLLRRGGVAARGSEGGGPRRTERCSAALGAAPRHPGSTASVPPGRRSGCGVRRCVNGRPCSWSLRSRCRHRSCATSGAPGRARNASSTTRPAARSPRRSSALRDSGGSRSRLPRRRSSWGCWCRRWRCVRGGAPPERRRPPPRRTRRRCARARTGFRPAPLNAPEAAARSRSCGVAGAGARDAVPRFRREDQSAPS